MGTVAILTANDAGVADGSVNMRRQSLDPNSATVCHALRTARQTLK